MQIVWLIYNSVIKPTEIVGIVSAKEQSQPEYFNVKNRDDTPFYQFPTIGIDELKSLLNSSDTTFIVDKKYLYKFKKNKKLYPRLIDVESVLWKHSVEFEPVSHDNYKYTPLTYYFDTIKEYRRLLTEHKLTDETLSEEYNVLLYASVMLETSFSSSTKSYTTEYNFFTASGRFHELNGNAISMRKEERSTIRFGGVKIELDLDGAHLRILDMLSGFEAILPPNAKAVQHIIDTNSTPIDKKGIYTALYSESFQKMEHPFFRKVSKRFKYFKSPLQRTHNNFNYIIQEYEVLIMSYLIYYFSCPQIRFVLYLYDGLLIDVDVDYLKLFLAKSKQYAHFPFKLSILDKKYFIHMSTTNNTVPTWNDIKQKAKMEGRVRVVLSNAVQKYETKEEDVKPSSDTENLTNQ